MHEYLNIYQASRESAGYTQERAAGLIGISVGSLQSYEQGRRIPSNSTVSRMIGIYGGTYLGYQHVQASTAGIGENVLPDVELLDLPTAVLRLLKGLNNLSNRKEDIIAIACDGAISDENLLIWDELMKEFDDFSATLLSVKYAKNKEM